MRKIFFALAILLLSSGSNLFAQIGNSEIETNTGSQDNQYADKAKKVNFFVVSKRKKGALDLATRFNVFRTRIKSIFRRKKFVAIVAKSGKEAGEKIISRLERNNGAIGTIWFDSHGMYKKGYSLFFIGHDEYSYKTINDSTVSNPLKNLRPYLLPESNIVIGSCYGGATYNRPSIDYKDTTRMNGDSLMIGLGEIFGTGEVYASESWVMTKPGLFLKRAAVAGFPLRKLFRDVCYKPAWESISKWNKYNATSKEFTPVNTITLDMYGNLIVRSTLHVQKLQLQKNIQENLKKLQPGLYK